MTTKFFEAPEPEISSFDRWIAKDYLAEYFSGLQEDERQVIQYFCDEMRAAQPGPVLFFGCGPGLNHVFLSAPYQTELVMADYLRANLDELDAWMQGKPDAHDWTDFVRYTLQCESGVEPDDDAINKRMADIRAAKTRLMIADASARDPMGAASREQFATVLSPFCAESITADKSEWVRYSRNIASLVRPGGLMLVAALRRSEQYRVGTRHFPSANIDETELRGVLLQDFRPDTIKIEVRKVPQHREQGYSGILLARAQKF
jgi:hypothetical protein